MYSVNGLRVPGDIIEHPETITVARIDAEKNAETRRVMVEIFGRDRYIRESGAKLIDEDIDSQGQTRKLWRRVWPDGRVLQTVEVLNSTPEADGSRRSFFLGVHPECRPLLDGGR